MTKTIRDILDELATTIHNLSPGDVGSMDRVLLPIDAALTDIAAILEEAGPPSLKHSEEDTEADYHYIGGVNETNAEWRSRLKKVLGK